MSPKNWFGRLAKICAGHYPTETREMGWTSPSRDKRYGLDSAQQRRQMWVDQGPTETRDMGSPIPGRSKTYGMDNSWQTKDIWGWHFPAGTRDFEWTIPGRDERFSSFRWPLLVLVHTPPAYLTDNGVKRSGCDFDHSSPSSSEVMNEWSYTPASPVRGA